MKWCSSKVVKFEKKNNKLWRIKLNESKYLLKSFVLRHSTRVCFGFSTQKKVKAFAAFLKGNKYVCVSFESLVVADFVSIAKCIKLCVKWRLCSRNISMHKVSYVKN